MLNLISEMRIFLILNGDLCAQVSSRTKPGGWWSPWSLWVLSFLFPWKIYIRRKLYSRGFRIHHILCREICLEFWGSTTPFSTEYSILSLLDPSTLFLPLNRAEPKSWYSSNGHIKPQLCTASFLSYADMVTRNREILHPPITSIKIPNSCYREGLTVSRFSQSGNSHN
jgi:hypothetical protein